MECKHKESKRGNFVFNERRQGPMGKHEYELLFFALNCQQRCTRNHDVGRAIVFIYPFEPTRSDVN